MGDDQPGAALAHGPLQMHVQHGDLFAGVQPQEEDHVRGRVRAILGLHHIGQSGHARGQGGDLAAVAVVNVVGADDLAHEALEKIVALVAQLGAADAAQGVRAVLLLGRFQPGGGGAQGLLPCDGDELAVLAHHGLGQAVVVVDPGVGEAALVADPLVVDRHVLPAHDAAQGVRAGVQAQVAAHGTVGTNAGCALGLPGAEGEAADPVGQRAHGADIDDVAAGLGVHFLAGLDVDDGLAAPLEEAQLGLVLPFLQIAGAAPADHAALLVQHDGVGDGIVFLLEPLGLDHLAEGCAVAHGLVLQGTFTALVADGAVQGMVEQHEGQIGLLHFLDLGRVGAHDHAFGHGHGAGRVEHDAPGGLELHQAHAAAAHRVQLGVAAEDGNLDMDGGRGIHHQGALGHADGFAVDGEGDKISHGRFGSDKWE